MDDQDVRWIQRFHNFSNVLNQLTRFMERGELNEMEKQGLIKAFEYTYELAWNTIKDYFEFQGESNIRGSRDAFRLAFKYGLVEDGEVWMNMIKSRIMSAHTYNEEMAERVVTDIETVYFDEFVALHATFEAIQTEEE